MDTLLMQGDDMTVHVHVHVLYNIIVHVYDLHVDKTACSECTCTYRDVYLYMYIYIMHTQHLNTAHTGTVTVCKRSTCQSWQMSRGSNQTPLHLLGIKLSHTYPHTVTLVQCGGGYATECSITTMCPMYKFGNVSN